MLNSGTILNCTVKVSVNSKKEEAIKLCSGSVLFFLTEFQTHVFGFPNAACLDIQIRCSFMESDN